MRALKIIVLLVCMGFMLISFTTTGSAQEKALAGHQVIKLHYGTGISPETLTVNRGTTVIWINEAMAPVCIKFTDKRITAACENPVNFVKDTDGSFISDKVPFGAVASMCFIEKGTYAYMVKRDTRIVTEVQKGKIESGKEYKGTIIVE